MPALIATPADPAPVGLDAFLAAVEDVTDDLADAAVLAAQAPLLAALAADRRFLGDIVAGELERRCDRQAAANAYGPQVLMLAPANGRYLVRANIWPAAADAAYRTSGPDAFVYGMPHDHDFSFLTAGYLGPGYESEDYEWDRDAAIGLPGEPVALRSAGRSRLGEGQAMLYRAHRDIHVQHPPAALSVSLNLIAQPRGAAWREQYRFDPATGTIAAGLSVTASEALIAIAPHLSEAGAGLTRHFAAHHPEPRMRATAVTALAAAANDPAERVRLLERAADDASAYVAGQARRALATASGSERTAGGGAAGR